jgi:ribonuclease J
LTSPPVKIIFLGGLGEIGRNMLAVEMDGRVLVIDAGLSFPNDEMLGVDLVLPDFSYVTERAAACEGVILTHGHEDHVGALTWLLREVPVPVYGSPLTLGIARRRLDEFKVDADLRVIGAPGELRLGPFDLRFLAMSHSIPDALSVAITTPHGVIYYTGDFKLDETPIDGRLTDVDGIRELGDKGLDLLLSDSTNAERSGRTPSERIVGDALRDIFTSARRRIIVACFASNLHRIQQVCETAEAFERKVAFVGRSMVANLEVGRELGYLKMSDDTVVPIDEIDRLPPDRSVILCTGSQGEPLSALSLISGGEHKRVRAEPGDTVILSAHPIPGNESSVHRVLNGLYKSGADVYHSGTSPVHVSGHGGSEELAEMISLARPRNFVPVHGEYRQLALHSRIAQEQGIPENRISIVEDGDVLELKSGEVRRAGRVPAGMVLVDGLGVGDVGPVVLRDRRHLAQDGVIVCVVTIDSQSGEILAGPDLISRGFVFEDESRDLLEEAADRVLEALEKLEADRVTEWATIKQAVRRTLGSFVWERTRRRPMILPIITEV